MLSTSEHKGLDALDKVQRQYNAAFAYMLSLEKAEDALETEAMQPIREGSCSQYPNEAGQRPGRLKKPRPG